MRPFDSPRLFAGMLLVLVVAPIPFLFVGASRLPMNFWGLPLAQKLRLIAKHVGNWNGINRWFVAAALLSTGGLALVAWQLRGATLGHFAAVGAVTYAIGSTLWIVELSSRLNVIVAAAREVERSGNVPAWAEPIATFGFGLFTTYAILSHLATIAIGIALVSSDLVPLWAGWAMLGSGSLLLTAQLLTGDNIPAMNYIGPVVLGLALLTTK